MFQVNIISVVVWKSKRIYEKFDKKQIKNLDYNTLWMLKKAKIPTLYAKHSPYVDYKDNKNQDKKYDNCNYFTVYFTILNPGIFYTSCNIKRMNSFINMVFWWVENFFLHTLTPFFWFFFISRNVEKINWRPKLLKQC